MNSRCAGTNRALGLSNELFVLGDSVVLTVLSQVAFMPVLVLAARLCPEARPHSCCCHLWNTSLKPTF